MQPCTALPMFAVSSRNMEVLLSFLKILKINEVIIRHWLQDYSNEMTSYVATYRGGSPVVSVDKTVFAVQVIIFRKLKKDRNIELRYIRANPTSALLPLFGLAAMLGG